jgi:hypothetical protein
MVPEVEEVGQETRHVLQALVSKHMDEPLLTMLAPCVR